MADAIVLGTLFLPIFKTPGLADQQVPSQVSVLVLLPGPPPASKAFVETPLPAPSPLLVVSEFTVVQDEPFQS